MYIRMYSVNYMISSIYHVCEISKPDALFIYLYTYVYTYIYIYIDNMTREMNASIMV